MVTALPARAAFRWKILVLAFIVAISGAFAASENSEIAKRRAGERRTFSDGEILDGFFKITFGAEFHVAGRVDRIRKFETPVRVFADGEAPPDRRAQPGQRQDERHGRADPGALGLQVDEGDGTVGDRRLGKISH